MTATTTETALATREESTGELQPSQAEASAQHEIQSAVILARRFPRDEDRAFGALMKSCRRPSFACDVTYSFPRGGTTISGPSVYLAREFARLWGNIRYGGQIVVDVDDLRTVRGWAWDLETNAYVCQESSFSKLIQRKNKRTGETQWIEPDERDLRELTNKHMALCVRNCLLGILPSDMVDDAIAEARKTLEDKAAQDPDATRKAIVKSFVGIGVTADNLKAYVGRPLEQCGPEELAELRRVFKSIKDGHTTWVEVAAARSTKADETAARLAEKAKERQPGEDG